MASESKNWGCSHCDFTSNNYQKAKHHVRQSNKTGGRFICSCEELTACFFEQLVGDHGHFDGCESYNWELRTLGPSAESTDSFKETCNFSRKRPQEKVIVLALFDREEESEGGSSGEEADDEMSSSSEGETEVEEENEGDGDDEMSVTFGEESEGNSTSSVEDVECERG